MPSQTANQIKGRGQIKDLLLEQRVEFSLEDNGGGRGQDSFHEPTEQKTGNELDRGDELGLLWVSIWACLWVSRHIVVCRPRFGVIGKGVCHTNEGKREGRVARNRGMPSGILWRM